MPKHARLIKPRIRRWLKLLLLLAGAGLLMSMLISLAFALGEADGFGKSIVIAEMLVLGYAAFAISGIFKQAASAPHHRNYNRVYDTFDRSPSGLAIVALSGRFIRANPALCDITGYTMDELASLTFQDITHQDDLAMDLSHVDELLNNERSFYRIQKRYIHKSGTPVEVYLWGSVVRDHDGEPLYFIAQIDRVAMGRMPSTEIFPFDRRSLRAGASHNLDLDFAALTRDGGLLIA